MALIKAFQKDAQLINDIRSSTNNTDGFRVWWLGQSGFLLQWQGKHVLFDPYLSDSLTIKYANTDKPHVRMSELVVKPELLDMIDIVTSSHNHTDHLDADTLKPLFKVNPGIKFVIPEANRDFVSDRCGISSHTPIGITFGSNKMLDEFEFTGLPAAHNELKVNDHGHHLFMSYVVKFGDYCVYHSGDTLWYDGMEDLLSPFKIDVAFLPINGNKPERKVAGNLSADEAARLGKKIGAGISIPHHYDMFEFNTADPLKFKTACQRTDTNYKILSIGESAGF